MFSPFSVRPLVRLLRCPRPQVRLLEHARRQGLSSPASLENLNTHFHMPMSSPGPCKTTSPGPSPVLSANLHRSRCPSRASMRVQLSQSPRKAELDARLLLLVVCNCHQKFTSSLYPGAIPQYASAIVHAAKSPKSRVQRKQLNLLKENRHGPRRTPCRSATKLVPKCRPPTFLL